MGRVQKPTVATRLSQYKRKKASPNIIEPVTKKLKQDDTTDDTSAKKETVKGEKVLVDTSNNIPESCPKYGKDKVKNTEATKGSEKADEDIFSQILHSVKSMKIDTKTKVSNGISQFSSNLTHWTMRTQMGLTCKANLKQVVTLRCILHSSLNFRCIYIYKNLVNVKHLP